MLILFRKFCLNEHCSNVWLSKSNEPTLCEDCHYLARQPEEPRPEVLTLRTTTITMDLATEERQRRISQSQSSDTVPLIYAIISGLILFSLWLNQMVATHGWRLF